MKQALSNHYSYEKPTYKNFNQSSKPLSSPMPVKSSCDLSSSFFSNTSSPAKDNQSNFSY